MTTKTDQSGRYRPCGQCPGDRCRPVPDAEPTPGDCYDAWLGRAVRAYLGRPQ